MRSPVLLLVIALGVFGAIGAVLLLRSIFQNKSDESTWNDLTDQHRPVRVSNPSAFTPGVYERLVVISAPYALCHHDPWDHLSCSDLDDTRNMLASGWDIHSRIDLLAQIFWLITLGDRDKFGVERAQWADASLAEAERQELQELKEAGIAVQDITEKLWRLERMRNNDRGIQNVDFLAWDMLRAAMLTRCGAALNWLPEAEAWDTLALLDQALRMHYQNWGQVWESFRLGRWCWYSEDGEDAHYNDLHDLHRLQVLLAPEGPWGLVPWDIPVPQSSLMILDDSIDAGVAAPLDADERERAPQWERWIDDQVILRGQRRSQHFGTDPERHQRFTKDT